jgi:hypothetical protein
MKPKFNPGDVVQSRYRNQWFGIVMRCWWHVDRLSPKGIEICVVLRMMDVYGNLHRKPTRMKLHPFWLNSSPKKLQRPDNWNYLIKEEKPR